MSESVECFHVLATEHGFSWSLYLEQWHSRLLNYLIIITLMIHCNAEEDAGLSF
jgi:hypothetical protein